MISMCCKTILRTPVSARHTDPSIRPRPGRNRETDARLAQGAESQRAARGVFVFNPVDPS